MYNINIPPVPSGAGCETVPIGSGFCLRAIMKAYVYIDGFNLYYNAVKGTPYKWLDLHKLCGLILPEYSIVKIKYFTARVSARKADPKKPSRQQIYLRAIKTIPDLEVIYGRYISRDTPMAKSNLMFGNGRTVKFLRKILWQIGIDYSILDKRKIVKVIKTEEKGSDVNLATHLLVDGFDKRYDVAVVLSNDSDLAAPIIYVRDTLGRPVIIICPDSTTSKVLVSASTSVRKVRRGVVIKSQFPDVLIDKHGKFHKPEVWKDWYKPERSLRWRLNKFWRKVRK